MILLNMSIVNICKELIEDKLKWFVNDTYLYHTLWSHRNRSQKSETIYLTHDI